MASHVIVDFLVVIFASAIFVMRMVLARRFRKRKVHTGLQGLVLQSLNVAFWLIIALYGLTQLGIHVGTLVTGLGLGGFALGFALKDLLSNIVAGAMILLYHPFNIGDNISVAGQSGIVASISLRYTELTTDGQRILVPNQSIFSNSVVIKQ